LVIAKEFDYQRPATLEEATAILVAHPGETTRILAGGTDLVAWLRDDAVAPDLVVDIKDIPDLRDIRMEGDTLHLGSLTTFTDLIESDIVEEHAPLLIEMASTVASAGIRNRATMVGNICSAVPSCDAGPVLLALDTTVHLAGPGGARSVHIDDWFVGLRQTALTDDEVVTHVTIKLQEHGGAYVKLMRYAGEDLAQAAVGIVVYPDHDYRVAFGAVAPTPIRSARIEEALAGKPLDESLIAEVVGMVPDEISPITDMRATAEYRTHMCQVMLKRGLEAAVQRLAGIGPAYETRLI
ncbi:MAG: xanthine dehydrogenase family protein subunit M, partial [Acidimicrobiia bacterium]|nr:xanthine dehydrogenase family protein subunit M [Acidimicrobiia bacterium]